MILKTRRQFINVMAVASVALAAPSILYAQDTPWAEVGYDRILVANTNGDRLAVRFRTGQRYDASNLQRLNWLWRDWRDGGAQRQIDPLLFGDLALIQTRMSLDFGEPKLILINSGFRTAGRNATIEGAARNSQHVQGRACDFNMVGVSPALVVGYAESYGVHGLGQYSDFTHIDVGPPNRRWTG
ncbi:YcbK family protein [Phaeobacter inhibens]|uniref:YcbK family protein n=1 Tax=Phaeobacter inhibens TaxID=221822 RepID=UPI000C9A8717|nr:DUF882 domain-containing protein [Phaeobacter inhibens]AUR22546.1 putative protein in bacteria [Phaeobacter inhibens]